MRAWSSVARRLDLAGELVDDLLLDPLAEVLRLLADFLVLEQVGLTHAARCVEQEHEIGPTLTVDADLKLRHEDGQRREDEKEPKRGERQLVAGPDVRRASAR